MVLTFTTLGMEKHYYSLSQALDKCFKKATRISSANYQLLAEEKKQMEQHLGALIKNKHVTIYEGFEGDKHLGFALILDEQGKYEPITFMTCVDSEFVVKDVVLMVYREKIGASVRKNRFLKQFFGKKLSDSLMVDQDIDAVSGATISSWTLTKGVKKAMLIMKQLKSKQHYSEHIALNAIE